MRATEIIQNAKTLKVEYRWENEEFLDDLRRQGDQQADECFKEILTKEDYSKWLNTLKVNDDRLGEEAPPPLRTFVTEATRLPFVGGQPVDVDRIKRGQKVFMGHALPSALVLLTKSLPEGYAAPNLSTILGFSDNLKNDPYQRLLGVLQMVINVTAVGGFDPTGQAIMTIPKIRLLHAGVRHIVHSQLPNYETKYGKPVNLEDLLATVMGFSYLVITGLRELNIGVSEAEEEDMFYLWRVFAQMMGIHPQNEPNNSLYVPGNLKEAQRFYEAYSRRHFVEAAQNPEGVQLAQATLDMLNDLLPQTPLRRLGLKIVPRIYMEQLMGRETCVRIGIEPVRFLYLTKFLLHRLPGLWARLWDIADQFDPKGHFHENLSRVFFQALIHEGVQGEITWVIPKTRKDLVEMVRKRNHKENLPSVPAST